MTASLIQLPRPLIVDANGTPRAGAKLYVYSAGTSTPLTVYQDADKTIPHSSPIVANTDGLFPPIYPDPTTGDIKINITVPGTPTDIQISGYPVDNIPVTYDSAAIALSLDSLKRTDAEIAAGETPVNYTYPPQVSVRYETNMTPGTTDMASGIQAAIDSASQSSAEVKITDLNGLSKPLMIRSTTQQNLSIIGNGRVSSGIRALAANISTAPVSVNALIINQSTNAQGSNVHLTKMRWLPDVVAYTGVFMYSKNGGGADASGKTLFSAVFYDDWFSPSSNNSGCFDGDFSNCVWDTCVFESIKTGCIITETTNGSSDLRFTSITLNASFDAFFLDQGGTDLVSLDGQQAYNHQRGILINSTGGTRHIYKDVKVETLAGNFGSVGLFRFSGCTDIICDGFQQTVGGLIVQGDTAITIDGNFTGKFCNGKINANVGLKFTGTGTVDITLDNVDFTGCTFAVQFASGATAGTIRTRNCRFNDQQGYGWLSTVTGSWNWYSENDGFVNAGLRGTATDRNLQLSTSGEIILTNPQIGQNNGSAAAAYYLNTVGSGTITIINPRWVGTPPTALQTGAQIPEVIWLTGFGGVLASAATVFLPNSGDIFSVSGSNNITGIDSTLQEGRTIKLAFQGALTVVNGGNLKLSANFVTTSLDTLILMCISSTWYELSRSVN